MIIPCKSKQWWFMWMCLSWFHLCTILIPICTIHLLFWFMQIDFILSSTFLVHSSSILKFFTFFLKMRECALGLHSIRKPWINRVFYFNTIPNLPTCTKWYIEPWDYKMCNKWLNLIMYILFFLDFLDIWIRFQ
jgi:hypothetical protein